MTAKILVTYVDGKEESFEGTVRILATGWFQISKKLDQGGSLLASVEERTDSTYIPQTAIRKVETQNEEE